MAKDNFTLPNYADLGLKNNQESKVIVINGVEIEVFQYLPIIEKYKLINLTLSESLENNVYNPLKIEVFFNLNLIFNYSTLSFSAEELLDPYDLFDKLEQNEVFEKIIAIIPETEYKYLLENLITTMTRNTQYIQSVAASLDVVFEQIPKLTEGMDELKKGLQSGDLKADNVADLANQLGLNFTDILNKTEESSTETTVKEEQNQDIKENK